jgi:hypothetical protein
MAIRRDSCESYVPSGGRTSSGNAVWAIAVVCSRQDAGAPGGHATRWSQADIIAYITAAPGAAILNPHPGADLGRRPMYWRLLFAPVPVRINIPNYTGTGANNIIM